jgi:hypothetical protein
VVDACFLWVRMPAVSILDWFLVWAGQSDAGVVQGRSDGPEEC